MTGARVIPRAAGVRNRAVAGLAVIIGLGLLLGRLDLAVAVLAAGFFLSAYLNRGAGILTIDKAQGVLALMAWGVDWAVNRRPVLVNRQLGLICAFLLWTGVSISHLLLWSEMLGNQRR